MARPPQLSLRLDNGRYPTTEQGLPALWQQPTSEPRLTGVALRPEWRSETDQPRRRIPSLTGDVQRGTETLLHPRRPELALVS